MEPDDLTPFEHEVIAAILRPDHPVMNALRAQFAVCRVSDREFTGHGFYTGLIVPSDVAAARVTRDQLRLGGEVGATLDGLDNGAGFVLWIAHGMLDCLEGFAYDQPWPERIENYSVIPVTGYRGEGVESDLEQAENAWDRSEGADLRG
jgi:hypothetical protein